MDPFEKSVKAGDIAKSALGHMMREIIRARKEKPAPTANQILENIVLRILKQSQQDIQNIGKEVTEAVEATDGNDCVGQ